MPVSSGSLRENKVFGFFSQFVSVKKMQMIPRAVKKFILMTKYKKIRPIYIGLI
jgi:uncharacterized membrane protein